MLSIPFSYVSSLVGENQYKDVQYKRFSGKTENRTILGLTISRPVLKNQINLETGIEYIYWENPGFDPFEPDQSTRDKIEKWSFSFGIFYNFN